MSAGRKAIVAECPQASNSKDREQTVPQRCTKHGTETLMATELLIFDCDGVLIDSEPVASLTFCRALQNAGVDISHEEVWRRFTGYAEVDAKRICREELGLADVDGIFAESRLALYGDFARTLSPMPGMPQLVRSLPQRKCVASNSTMERLKNSLGLLDLWHEFAPHIFSAEMVGRPKPAPDLFLHCANEFGVDPVRCLVVDDSPHGIAGAVAAGMQAIGFIDPADPRSDRRAVLVQAGARLVVTGAAGLRRAFDALLADSPSDERDAAKLRVPA